MKTEGAPCYAFRARRFRGSGGPLRLPSPISQGEVIPWVKAAQFLSNNGPPTADRSESGLDPHVLIPL